MAANNGSKGEGRNISVGKDTSGNDMHKVAARAAPSLRIAFGCQARVGKDAAADYMAAKYTGTILRFADPLKDIMAYAQQRCGFEQAKDTRFLQMVGTDWARNRDPDVWVKLLISQVEGSDSNDSTNGNGGHFFVSDLRFRNEADALKRAGFTCVRIKRDDRAIDRDQTHQSEMDLIDWDGWDYVIENDGSLGDLYAKLDDLTRMGKQCRCNSAGTTL